MQYSGLKYRLRLRIPYKTYESERRSVMDNLECMRGRLEQQQIREFILNGCEGEPVEGSYSERLAGAQGPLMCFLEREVSGEEKQKQADELVAAALGACEDVYFELGMQAGARLLLDLLRPDAAVALRSHAR